jgi:hypothetical protein
MSLVTSQVDVHTPFDLGPALQAAINTTNLGLAATINKSSNINSNIIFSNGYRVFSFFGTSTQAGTISIQRYADVAGTIKQGSALTGSLTSNTAAIVSTSDTLPFQSLQINITNSSGSTAATLSNILLLLQSY